MEVILLLFVSGDPRGHILDALLLHVYLLLYQLRANLLSLVPASKQHVALFDFSVDLCALRVKHHLLEPLLEGDLLHGSFILHILSSDQWPG